ncbi:MAG: 16S rRNA (guanine(966)-N(2))-methyltransferase RsmD [Elusimicrobia bacterium RIFOXYC2_FULL_34_12]|nr:MAG: 16S rRNA (guanine(966)-N(2))-methyltransferase RsmD [Elusimicrobia bacterium RIFOXYC2_FULL_34_12]OGS38433.1 MAG: 16S rRNA (guanine(966)-N(2))-methyltransferase RsmD [Elusimicrobia bacterium RIFOXYD2_FULL_34_30]HAM38181.1 16S rRNA (guanine(966)-N(2))-methyltransferase RsmD [Elusimicrobiota bacterium]
MALKIIAGQFKGRNLLLPTDLSTRPLLMRAKKSLFDILTPKIIGSVFLDLFAGTGSVGIEALSRGAKKVVFVENGRECVKLIEENLKNLGVSDKAEVLRYDAAQPNFLNEKFDIIFIGPPYSMKNLAVVIEKSEVLLARNGIIIGQHQFREMLPEKLGEMGMYRQEKYGDMRLSFFSRSDSQSKKNSHD